jgi:3-methylfumaryl-CoA hydratase
MTGTKAFSNKDANLVEDWKQKAMSKTLVEHDNIAASQFNLMANTLPFPSPYKNALLPQSSTKLPPAWHLAYFPPRVPESELSSDGYEKDWSPPEPFVHRMWAGGELRWSKENPLRVGEEVSMTSKLREVQLREGGRRGDSVFLWVDKHLNNQNGWSVTESRCWVYVKQAKEEAGMIVYTLICFFWLIDY